MGSSIGGSGTVRSRGGVRATEGPLIEVQLYKYRKFDCEQVKVQADTIHRDNKKGVANELQRVPNRISLWPGSYEREYFPQMCRRNTQAIKSKLITSTGTGPLQNGMWTQEC